MIITSNGYSYRNITKLLKIEHNVSINHVLVSQVVNDKYPVQKPVAPKVKVVDKLLQDLKACGVVFKDNTLTFSSTQWNFKKVSVDDVACVQLYTKDETIKFN